MITKFQPGEEVMCEFHGETIPGVILDIRKLEARRKDNVYTERPVYTVLHNHGSVSRPYFESYDEDKILGSLDLTEA